jgi:tetratricopeptide (TPR) repeat protein
VYRWKAHSEIGSSYVLEGNDEKAVEWFKRGLENAPSVQPLQINLARALERLKQCGVAEQLFASIHGDHIDNASTLEFVNFLLRQGRGLDALAVVDRSHALLTDEIGTAVLLAASQVATQHGLPSAIDYLRLAAELSPGAAEVLNPLEAALRERGLDEELHALLMREVNVEPKVPADFLRRSHQALVAGQYADAKRLAIAGLERAPGDTRLRYNAALALSRLGEADAAIEKLRGIDPDQLETYAAAELLVATTERGRDRIDEAIAAIERLLAFVPTHVEALALRGSLYEQRGEHGLAERAFRSFFAADRQRGAIELASFYLRQQRFDEAASVADEALRA